MVDDQTGTVWSHLDGVALDGPLAGAHLEVLPLQTTTWAAWREQWPDTTTPDLNTGFVYRRVQIAGSGLSRTFLDTLDGVDGRLRDNELVIGVLAGDEARAFPLREAPPEAPMQDTVGGVPIVVLEDSAGIPAAAYHRALSDGRVLDFELSDGAARDLETGSRWNASGLAVEGELAGVQLTFVTSFFTE